MALQPEYYRDLVRPVFSGKRWVLAFDALVGAAPEAKRLQELGAKELLCIGAFRGTGNPPPPEISIDLGIEAESMMETVRASERAIDHLPPNVLERVEEFDPNREARAIRTIFSEGRPVAGRSTYGARRPEWVALEDKLAIDAHWDAMGVPRAPSSNVRVGDMARAAKELDQGTGVVIAADNRDGWHGGAQHLRWVRSPKDLAEAEEFFGQCSDQVRVMPFLDGLPCSIHAVVFPNYVATFRPCEMVVFRVPGKSTLAYASASSFWVPDEAVTVEMRNVARTAGAYLREHFDYRGALTVDGVLTPEGFRPTELNPRFGAALGVLTRSLEALPLLLLHLCLIEGEELDYRPEELEEMIIRESLAAPGANAHRMLSTRVEDETVGYMRLIDGEWSVVDADHPHDATIKLGPAPTGGFLRVNLKSTHIAPGPPAGPILATALHKAAAHFGVDVGTLEAARDVWEAS